MLVFICGKERSAMLVKGGGEIVGKERGGEERRPKNPAVFILPCWKAQQALSLAGEKEIHLGGKKKVSAP